VADYLPAGGIVGAIGDMLTLIEELHRRKAELAARHADPFRAKVEAAVRGMQAISTHALLDLLWLPKTTGNGRRIAPTMRTLGFVPIKSRRLEPGGYRDTATRGWARPIRELRKRLIQTNTGAAGANQLGG
jgi:hypothetical protein